LRSSKAFVLIFVFALLAFAGGRGFRTQHLLEEHFTRHGRAFGAITQEQYLRAAQQLRDTRPGKNVLESRRPDGSGAKFDRRRGWFVEYDSDGTLRTFFIPNDGIRYFERQAKTNGPSE
jgi:pyocin large subunit-like protein